MANRSSSRKFRSNSTIHQTRTLAFISEIDRMSSNWCHIGFAVDLPCSCCPLPRLSCSKAKLNLAIQRPPKFTLSSSITRIWPMFVNEVVILISLCSEMFNAFANKKTVDPAGPCQLPDTAKGGVAAITLSTTPRPCLIQLEASRLNCC
jgi:hypothetical protein